MNFSSSLLKKPSLAFSTTVGQNRVPANLTDSLALSEPAESSGTSLCRAQPVFQRAASRLPLGCVILLLVALAAAWSTPVSARDYLDLAADVRKIPLAVPYFIDKANGAADERGKEMADMLGRALAFHGFFSLIPPRRWGGGQDADWRKLGAEMVVLGSYRLEGGRLLLEARLIDLVEDATLIGRRYRGAGQMTDRMLFTFCDAAIEKLTGEPGVASSRIAFVASSQDGKVKEIYVSDIIGRRIRQVTRHNSLAVSPRFSADGRRLLYTSYHRGRQVLYLTAPNAKTTRAISWRPGLNLAPAWSPVADQLVLSLSPDGRADLFLTEAVPPRRKQVRILKRLTRKSGINVSPSWSPDGQRIAFVSDRSGSPQIYVMEVASGATRRLTFEGAYNTAPSWSPKGDAIAYASLAGGTYQIFTISPEGGTPTQVTKSWGSHEDPDWSPDGRQIVFARKRDARQEICAIFKNGVGERVLFRLPGKQGMPAWSPRLAY